MIRTEFDDFLQGFFLSKGIRSFSLLLLGFPLFFNPHTLGIYAEFF